MAIGSPAHALKIDGFSDLRENTRLEAGSVEINIARHSGYCWGVQRAYDMTVAEAKKDDAPVATWGPLIHNPQTIEELEEEYGVSVACNVDDVDEGKVIVRTHGAPLDVQQELDEKGLEVIDATCPYVRVSQRYAAMLHKERYHVVIIGNPKHPEIISVLSYAGGEGTVVKCVDDVKKIPAGVRRIGVVVQTTMILDTVNAILAELTPLAQELRVFNTICYVTDERQSDAEEIAKANDFVVVIGGRASSNTKKLAVVAETFGARTQLIEGPENLDFEAFGDVRKIGILAGASTPNWLIDQVVEKIQDRFAS